MIERSIYITDNEGLLSYDLDYLFKVFITIRKREQKRLYSFFYCYCRLVRVGQKTDKEEEEEVEEEEKEEERI